MNRECTCHPQDNPPIPCAKRNAYSECKGKEVATGQVWLSDGQIMKVVSSLIRKERKKVREEYQNRTGILGDEYTTMGLLGELRGMTKILKLFDRDPYSEDIQG